MTKRKKLISIGLTALSLFAVGGQAAASDQEKIAYQDEVNSCIAEVADFADYEDAVRVRHTVVRTKRTRLGHVFTIDTSVFAEADGDAIREYASYCVVRGTKKPARFDISEKSAGA